MSFLSDLNPFAALAESTVGKIVEKALAFIPDPEAKAKFMIDSRNLDLTEEKMQFDNMTQQIAVNLEEAKSEKWWKAGGRPFIIWTCGGALFYNFIISPWLVAVVRIWIHDYSVPPLQIQDLLAITSSLLGLGYLRSQDKAAIVSAKSN